MGHESKNIVIAGEAGQGLNTVGNILVKSSVRSGYAVVVTQSYQSRIRGGHNTFAIRVGPEGVAAPQEAIDLLVALDKPSTAIHQSELRPNAIVVADAAFAAAQDPRCLGVPFKELGPARSANVIALGVVASLVGLSQDVVSQAMEDFFGRKHPELAEQNRTVLDKSFAWAAGQAVAFEKLAPVAQPRKRLMMNGNEAIALGALSAGLQVYSFYPMTPSTSIANAVISHAGATGVIVEQAEDEIAAINMALGASFAGALSMVGTSGGGFALMTEGVSLAGITETPVVIAVSQRPAPATGLPTRTEQGDLELVLYAGHGPFPRAIFAPGTVEECFWLTRKAFDLAEASQGSVFVLTDQFLADSYRAVEPFDVARLPMVRVGADESEVAVPYQRYAVTPSGVSPRLIPGRTPHLVVADSDEHTEDGHLTEDLDARVRQVDKRMRKLDVLRRAIVPPEHAGDDKPELLLVSWGSTKGAAAEAAALLRAQGRRTGTLHFSQVWPLDSAQFLPMLEAAAEVICVEGNATGQWADLLRRETGFRASKRILRYDGLPITPEYILRKIG
jgi:2-oxoglutarate ferredoxin oxidoreductase subunit alpha